jgi:Tfp pilus assembly protein PilN
MNQQINLYQPMFRKQHVVFSAAAMLQMSVFFVLVFACLYAYQYMQLKPAQNQLIGLDKEISQLNTQVTALEKKISKEGKNKLLENEITKLSSELEKRERIANLLQGKKFGNSSGFSAYLESFARKHVSGTWLTQVKINQGGTSLGLKGKTVSSELVPVYLQRLGDEVSLQGSSFNVMELSRVEKANGDIELNFSMSTN